MIVINPNVPDVEPQLINILETVMRYRVTATGNELRAAHVLLQPLTDAELQEVAHAAKFKTRF